MGVVVLLVLLLVLLVVTTGKQSQLPGLAWDGSLTILFTGKLHPNILIT